jgi:hypothetical protein
VVGVDPVLCRLFSQPSASIDEAVLRAPQGRGSTGTRRVAFHADRPDKDHTVTVDDLRDGWQRRAASMGIDTKDLVRVVGPPPPAGVEHLVDDAALSEGLDRLAASRSRVTERDLTCAVADAAPHGMEGAHITRAATALGEAAERWSPAGDDRGVGWTPGAVLHALGADRGLIERSLEDGTGRTALDGPERGQRPRSVADEFGHRGPRPVELVR